jgi:hypothetical protein
MAATATVHRVVVSASASVIIVDPLAGSGPLGMLLPWPRIERHLRSNARKTSGSTARPLLCFGLSERR